MSDQEAAVTMEGEGETIAVPVLFSVLSMQKVHGVSRLVAVADVMVAIHDVEFVLAGCSIRVMPDGRYVARGPAYRHPHSGLWRDAIELPPELYQAFGAELMAVWEHGYD